MLAVEYLKSRIIGSSIEPVVVAIWNRLGAFRGKINPELDAAGREEAATNDVLRKIIGERSNCIDIGCHLGSVLHQITTLAPLGHHMAFEPMPQKARWLKRKFPKVDVRGQALGDRSGDVTFFVNHTRTGFSSLAKNGDFKVDRFEEITVRCDRLDDIVDSGRRVDFVKIDVEGGELPVLRGAAELFARDRPYLMFESMNFHFEKFGYTPRDMYDWLVDQMGYSIFLYTEFLAGGEPLDVDRYDAAHYYPFRAYNFLAAPRT